MDLLPLIDTAAHVYLVTLVLTWDSSGPSDSGPHLGFTWIWGLSSPCEAHQALLTMVLNWAKLGPGDSGLHLSLPWIW